MFDYDLKTFEQIRFAIVASDTLLASQPLPRYPGRRTPPPLWQRHFAVAAKRALDVVLALLLLMLLALPMLLIATVICCDSAGPALYRQTRIGLDGRRFALLKFRTMHHHPPGAADSCQACRGDPRVTRVGRCLRRSSLDELPQLLNVLKGDMALVGPRPHTPGTRAGGRLFEDVASNYHERHRVRPGMTGLAQIRGWRGETDTEDKLLCRIDSDLEYILAWSPMLDLWIIWRTIGAVLRMRNAY